MERMNAASDNTKAIAARTRDSELSMSLPLSLIVEQENGVDFPLDRILDRKGRDVRINRFPVGDCLNGKCDGSEWIALDSGFDRDGEIVPDRTCGEWFLSMPLRKRDGFCGRNRAAAFDDHCFHLLC